MGCVFLSVRERECMCNRVNSALSLYDMIKDLMIQISDMFVFSAQKSSYMVALLVKMSKE